MTVLIIDRDTQFCSKVCDVLKETNPGLEYEMSTGAWPFDELQSIENGKYKVIVIGEPACSIDQTNSQPGNGIGVINHSVEWIEALRFGGIWRGEKKISIKEKSKLQQPILYIHKYTITNQRHYPDSFPIPVLTRQRSAYNPGKLQKFVTKWYKSLGASSVCLQPLDKDAMLRAMNDAINYKMLQRDTITNNEVIGRDV